MNGMKCRKCGEKAVIHMRQHRLALCKEHYLEWFVAQTERFIEKYHMFTPQDTLLVAVSGGKDSLALWDVLWRLGYQADGLYINLGIAGEDQYSHESQQRAAAFAAQRNLRLHVADVKADYGESIPEIALRTHRGRGRPCSVCGLVKRHIMNHVSFIHNYDVLATAHNLDDEAAVLFANTLNWSIDLLKRQAPVLESAPGFVRKVKPFCRFYERETAAYTLLSGIDYIYEECPHSVGSKSLYYKQLLNQMEAEQPGAKLRFYLAYLNARKNGFLPAEEQSKEERYANRCPICGQPTSAPGLCAFCKLVNASTHIHPALPD